VSFADKLTDLVSYPPVNEPRPTRENWGFTQEYAPHDPFTRTITATTGQRLDTEDDWTQFVIDNGGALAEGYRVRLVEMRHNTHGWSRAAQGEDAVTSGTWFYRFMVEPLGATTRIEEVIEWVNSRKPAKLPEPEGEAVFHWLAGDLQLGKVDGDGTSGVVERVTASIDAAVEQYKRLRKSRSVGLVHIAWLGDCLEGNVSQNGRNFWRTELTVTEQVRVFRRLMMYSIDAFAAVAPEVQVDVVNGNHDQVQRFQETRADDGHATEAAIAVADALTLNPAAYGHVKIFVPNKDESYITREIGTSIITMAHGHQWRNGKAFEWWKGQSFNLQAPGSSHFLFHGHEHQFSINSNKERVRICVPTYESESTWWRHKTGDQAKTGGLVLITLNGEFSDMGIV